ncbi:MAG: 4Fe-4S binding protein [Clostridia bacterium]
MLQSSGVPESELIDRARPPLWTRRAGPVVWVECFQSIPCDPCHTACPSGAIAAFSDINDLPRVDHSLCTGCGLCVAACPGLAIFVIDESIPGDYALISLPYELNPLPKVGDMVNLLDRAGVCLGEGEVTRVRNPKVFDKTSVVTVRVPDTLVESVRAISVKGGTSCG